MSKPTRDDVVRLASFRADQWGVPTIVMKDKGGEYFFTTLEEWNAGKHPEMQFIQRVEVE